MLRRTDKNISFEENKVIEEQTNSNSSVIAYSSVIAIVRSMGDFNYIALIKRSLGTRPSLTPPFEMSFERENDKS